MRIGRWVVMCGLLVVSVGVGAESGYEHPLLDGGGASAIRADFAERFADFIDRDGKGGTGEALLESYFGGRRNTFIPDLVVGYAKGRKDPVMALVYRGRTADRLPNEAYVWVAIFTEDGSPLLSIVPTKPTPPVTTKNDVNDVCLSTASQLQVRLEGMAYEREKDSGINAMEVIKMYTGKEPSIIGQKPLDGDCAAVDLTKTGPVPGTRIRKAMMKFPLEKEAMYRVSLLPTGEQRSAEVRFANMRLSWFGAGVGVGAQKNQGWFKKGTVKPFIFGHLYVSKFLNRWNRSTALVVGVPLESEVNEATAGLRWSPVNEWKNPDFSRFGLIVGYNYHRPIDDYAGTGKQWRFIVGVDYKL